MTEKNDKQEVKTYHLTRDGMRDLEVKGVCLSDASDHHYTGPKQNRWTEVSIYETEKTPHRYAAAIVRRTCWQGESDRYSAFVADKPEDLWSLLEDEGGLEDVAKEALEKAGIPAIEEL